MDTKKKVASIDYVTNEANGTEYDTVEAYGTLVGIGSLSSADMIEWVESRDDAEKKKFAGLWLIVKSLVGPEEDGYPRIPEDKRPEALKKFEGKDARQNGKVVAAILKLNGFDSASKKLTDEAKNGSGEVAAVTDASPSASPLQPVG